MKTFFGLLLWQVGCGLLVICGIIVGAEHSDPESATILITFTALAGACLSALGMRIIHEE